MSHSSDRSADTTGHWRSLAERDGAEAYLERLEHEFLADPTGTPDDVSRRRFLQVMGASIALAGVAGCEWPQEEIVPFGKRPEGYRPGRIVRFATTLDYAGRTRPVLVSSYDGRPIKIEGNPEHPMSLGATDAWAQASVLDLYDPDRSRAARAFARGIEVPASPAEVAEFVGRTRESIGDGSGVAVLTGANASASLDALRARTRVSLPRLRWFEASAFDRAQEIAGLESLGMGRGFARPDLDGAGVIVDVEADLLGTHPNAVRNARDYAAGRNPESGGMNRLYSFEASMTVTGSTADHRVPMSSRLAPAFLVALAGSLAHQIDAPGFTALGLTPSAVRDARAVLAADARGERILQVLEVAATDLVAQRGRALVALGAHHAPASHALCWAINDALAGVGQTVHFQPRKATAVEGGVSALTDALNAGRIHTLIVVEANPVYDAPNGIDFAAAYAKAGRRIHFGTHIDETAVASSWHLPVSQVLEAWGDAWAEDGSYCAVQPLIEPLYGTSSSLERLSQFFDSEPMDGHALVRQTFHEMSGGSGAAPDSPDFEAAWRRFLHAGFVTRSRGATGSMSVSRTVGEDVLAAVRSTEIPSVEALEAVVTLDTKVFDGRFANNAWMQELPDPLTKLTWDNVAVVSVALADEIGIRDGDFVRVRAEEREIELPAFVQPGQARYSVSIAAGYGRTRAGRVGDGVGVNAWRLVENEAAPNPTVSIEKTGHKTTLACTQDHYLIDPRGRDERERRVAALAREGTVEEFHEHPEFVQHRGIHHPPLESLWKEREWAEGPQWGMAIDLNVCTGCSACVTACQAENNISVVGRQQVINGREMHWLRIDRYFQGDPDDPAVIQQPVGCAQCEMAPCEGVCPVGATMHSNEGLNVMAYNRCVGTRYCSNNCPYKVRRFNFFNYHKDLTQVEELAFNPEVTVRARGVMEKCTYCVQRIEHARISAKNAGRPIRDGDVVTACQQTCPSQAITFGDLRDPESEVSKVHQDSRAYALLGELNLKPRTLFLAKLRNPHPALFAGDAHHGDAAAETPGHHG